MVQLPVQSADEFQAINWSLPHYTNTDNPSPIIGTSIQPSLLQSPIKGTIQMFL